MRGIAIVTGGTRGIGAAIAQRLRQRNYAVAATYHANDQAAEEFHRKTGIAVFKWDVADFNACAEGVQRVEAALGGEVAVLVNNAGITQDATLHKMAEAQWRAVLAANLDSCFNMCHAVIGRMRARKAGRIVNISSINGQKGQFGQTNYAAAKAGMLGFTRALAQESAALGITVNAVAPGYVATDMVASMKPEILDHIVAQIPAGRLGTPDDVASLVEFLVGEAASFVTGATFAVNGGQYMN